jgi:hypothetical protein
MPQGKYLFTKTVETQLKTRIDIREGDDGSFFGTLMLCDERGDVVESRQLGADELDPIVAQLTGVKERAVTDIGAVFVETEADPILEEVSIKR